VKLIVLLALADDGAPFYSHSHAEAFAALGAPVFACTPDQFPEMLAALPEKIYLTFDIDYFDPSLVPATGTPEPGGGHWYPTLRLLRHLFRTKTVVAMDLIEVAPIGGHPASDFLAAKLIYKSLGYLWEKEGRPDCS
jgi:arginase family enzyme